MKSPINPSLRVEPALRSAVEEVLCDAESSSSSVESALHAPIQQRRQQAAFIARGMGSRDQTTAADVYFSSDAVLKKLEAHLPAKKRDGQIQC